MLAGEGFEHFVGSAGGVNGGDGQGGDQSAVEGVFSDGGADFVGYENRAGAGVAIGIISNALEVRACGEDNLGIV